MNVNVPHFSSPRRWWAGLCVGLLAVTLILTGCDTNGDGSDDPDPTQPETVADIVSSSENDTGTLADALDQAGLSEDLENEDQTFTVFAPVNSAFENIDADELLDDDDLLSEVLTYHVVPDQALMAEDISDGQTVETLEGGELTFSVDGSSVQVNNASVTTADLEGSNGVVHLVDGVLLETVDAVDRAILTSQLSTMATAVEAAELAGDNSPLRTEEITLFAPADSAFDAYDVDFLVNNADLLGSVLNYHVVQGSVVTSDELSDGDTFTTATGDEIEITIDDGTVFVEGAPVTMADVEVSNGVVHVVGDVLLTNRSAAERLQVTQATEQLYDTVTDLGLGDAFADPNNTWTTFAPNNAAFEDVDLSRYSDEEKQEIIQYHTLDGITDSESLVQLLADNDGEVTIETLQGEDVTITERDDGSIVFNGGQATLNLDRADARASNGIIHMIDGVLFPPTFKRMVSYDLEAQSNDGAIADGVSGTVTFWEASANETVVTLELDEGATDTDVAHPAHIHDAESGDIAIYLSPIDGSGGGGTSSRVVNRSFDELASFDGYVNIHESVANLGTVVSQGDIGSNSENPAEAGLDLVESPRSTTYSLSANQNDGSVAPDGIPGSVTFRELTDGVTLVSLSLDPGTSDGATGADVSHPSHIHNNSASEGGSIEYYLSPIDGTDTEARSSKLVGESYDTLVSFDGYVNVHESVANLGDVVSQGDVGANASGN